MIGKLAPLAALVLIPIAAHADDSDMVSRGKYLVSITGCNDCHTPLKMGPNGPEPDMSRYLSGHPESETVTGPVKLDMPWMSASSATNTAISGPWGVSFTKNLTPDPETGYLNDWTVDQFIAMMRTGREKGMGRPVLPPMPWPVYGQMTDDDLKAIFAYLKTIPPVKNKVPNPLPPAG